MEHSTTGCHSYGAISFHCCEYIEYINVQPTGRWPLDGGKHRRMKLEENEGEWYQCNGAYAEQTVIIIELNESGKGARAS